MLLDGTDGKTAWPEEIAGVVVGGLGLTEAIALAGAYQNTPGVELYCTNRANRQGQAKRYALSDLQKDAADRFRFKARRDFDPSFRIGS